jgi:nucleotide-binding universal stress UspA family protein
MRKVIAAIDDTGAARAVLAAGCLVARLFDASLEALHVREDGARTAQVAAAAAGLELREITGSVVDAIVSEARAPEVAALALGARATPAGRRPAGHIALEVIALATKPVAVVPPEVWPQRGLERLLVPLDGTSATARAMEGVLDLACRCDLDIVILHVHDEESLPPFSDQPQHEAEAWVREFMARNCPAAVARTELRVGVPAHEVLATAVETKADLIMLGWAQDLAPGRAAVVREVLERGQIPVLLVPTETGLS